METTEVKVAIRPLKVIALVNVLLAAVLIVISLATPYWLEATDIQKRLWDCEKENCELHARRICQAASIIALAVTIAAFVMILYCLVNNKTDLPKSKLYVASIVAVFIAMTCLLLTLFVFPVVFAHVELQKYPEIYTKFGWHLSWSYGICWGAWLFLLGAAVLLLIDRKKKNVDAWNSRTVSYDTPL